MKGESRQKLEDSKEPRLEVQDVVDADYLEKELASKVGQLEAVAKSLDAKIGDMERTDPKKAGKMREALKQVVRKFSIVFGTMSVLFIAGVANHERTRYQVTEKLNQDGVVEYVHEDEETTSIIEYLSGKREMDRETRFRLSRTQVLESLDRDGIIYPKELTTSPEGKFIKIISDMKPNGDLRHDEHLDLLQWTLNSDGRDWLDIYVPGKLDRAGDVYFGLWKIERMTGSPRIRWIDDNLGLERSFEIGSGAIAWYNSLTNTLNIRSPNTGVTYTSDFARGLGGFHSVADIISESSHAKQFNENTVSSFATMARDRIRTLIGTIKTRSLEISDNDNYFIPGRFEYEAHQQIEPQLREEFNKELKKDEELKLKDPSKGPFARSH